MRNCEKSSLVPNHIAYGSGTFQPDESDASLLQDSVNEFLLNYLNYGGDYCNTSVRLGSRPPQLYSSYLLEYGRVALRSLSRR